MNIEKTPRMTHSLIGGMTTDYFAFWCKECGTEIPHLEFDSEDIIGVRLKSKCNGCGRESVFKINVMTPLRPA